VYSFDLMLQLTRPFLRPHGGAPIKPAPSPLRIIQLKKKCLR
jgi:hypothetical protein